MEESSTVSSVSSLFRVLRQARRQRGWTQSDVAERLGCRQSAVSMMERGRQGALSRSKLLELARLLDVEPGAIDSAGDGGVPVEVVAKCCPDPDCLSNVPYVVAGEVRLFPRLHSAVEDDTTYCTWCGEVLISRCPKAECGARVRSGSCCARCGSAYVPGDGVVEGESPEVWAQGRRDQLRDLLALTG